MKLKKNILFTSGMFPPALGGPGTVLLALIPKLIAEGYSCKVLTFGENDKDYGFPVIRTALNIPQPLRFLAVLWQIFRHSFGADVIYTMDTYSHGLCSLIASKLLFKPLIVRFTGDSAWEILFNKGKINEYIIPFQKSWHGFYSALLKFRRTIILSGADKIITDCQFLKKLVGVIGVPTEKVTVINNPAGQLPELQGFDKNIWKQKFNIKGPVLLSMSRLVPWKGVGILIKMIPSINQKFSGVTLLVAGDGPQESNLKKLVHDMNLGKQVIFLGVVGDKKSKREVYEVGDIVVQNTFYEGMSNSLVEAMSAGKPIITTDAGGNPEFVDNKNGIVVKYDDASAIEKAILDLLSSPDSRSRLGEFSKIKSREYSVEKLTEKNIAVIQSV